MFRQHAWESGSSWVADGAVRALLANSDLRRNVRWKILPFADPDGVAHGGVRFNRNGFDLNRNWDVRDPKRMPEITAQRQAMADWLKSGKTIDLFFTLHNTETGEYLEAAPGAATKPELKNLAERFFNNLKDHTTFSPTRPLTIASSTTTEGKPGRMTAVQGLWHDFQIPGFLMEQRISMNPKLGHLPEIEDRLAFGPQLVKTIADTLTTP